jgi:hypothetical protein
LNTNDRGHLYSRKRRGKMVVEKAGFPESHQERLRKAQEKRDREVRRDLVLIELKTLGIVAVGAVIVIGLLYAFSDDVNLGFLWIWAGVLTARVASTLWWSKRETGKVFDIRDWQSDGNWIAALSKKWK